MITVQRGFGAIAAIMVLVILAALAAGITTFSTGQQLASAQDIQSARAWQAAYAGTEWGLFRALKNNSCAAQTWVHPDYSDFNVAVVCTSNDYKEGQKEVAGVPVTRVIRVFQIVATASNGASPSGPCCCIFLRMGWRGLRGAVGSVPKSNRRAAKGFSWWEFCSLSGWRQRVEMTQRNSVVSG
jgi:MSHA biogenesis protein MshP